MTAPMVDYKIHWLKMMSVPESRAVVGRHDGINGRDRLLSSTVHGSMRGQRLQAIEGSPPNLEELPDACSFAPRCPHVREACREAVPEPVQAAPERMARCIRVNPA